MEEMSCWKNEAPDWTDEEAPCWTENQQVGQWRSHTGQKKPQVEWEKSTNKALCWSQVATEGQFPQAAQKNPQFGQKLTLVPSGLTEEATDWMVNAPGQTDKALIG